MLKFALIVGVACLLAISEGRPATNDREDDLMNLMNEVIEDELKEDLMAKLEILEESASTS